MFNPTVLVSSIFDHQDTDTINRVLTHDLGSPDRCVKVETRPHEDGVVLTAFVLDTETGDEVSRERFLIKAVPFST